MSMSDYPTMGEMLEGLLDRVLKSDRANQRLQRKLGRVQYHRNKAEKECRADPLRGRYLSEKERRETLERQLSVVAQERDELEAQIAEQEIPEKGSDAFLDAVREALGITEGGSIVGEIGRLRRSRDGWEQEAKLAGRNRDDAQKRVLELEQEVERRRQAAKRRDTHFAELGEESARRLSALNERNRERDEANKRVGELDARLAELSEALGVDSDSFGAMAAVHRLNERVSSGQGITNALRRQVEAVLPILDAAREYRTTKQSGSFDLSAAGRKIVAALDAYEAVAGAEGAFEAPLDPNHADAGGE